jgi:hypothetical protein
MVIEMGLKERLTQHRATLPPIIARTHASVAQLICLSRWCGSIHKRTLAASAPPPTFAA